MRDLNKLFGLNNMVTSPVGEKTISPSGLTLIESLKKQFSLNVSLYSTEDNAERQRLFIEIQKLEKEHLWLEEQTKNSGLNSEKDFLFRIISTLSSGSITKKEAQQLIEENIERARELLDLESAHKEESLRTQQKIDAMKFFGAGLPKE